MPKWRWPLQCLAACAFTLIGGSATADCLFPTTAPSVDLRSTEPPHDLTLLESLEYGKCSLQLRPRLELVEPSAAVAASATAGTGRTVFGWQTRPWHGWSATAEALNVSHWTERFDASAPGSGGTARPVNASVADPTRTDFNRLFAEYWSDPGAGFSVTARAGRQSLGLDNQRFIADDDFRQIPQIFTGLTGELAASNADLFLGQIDRRRDIFGREHPTSLSIVNARIDLSNDDLWSPIYRQRMGDADESWKNADRVSVYGYWQDESSLKIRSGETQVPGSGTALCSVCSNRIVGLRFAGAHAVDPSALLDSEGSDWIEFWSGVGRWNQPDRALLYTLEYARQSSYRGGDGVIDVRYSHVGIGLRFAVDSSWWKTVDQFPPADKLKSVDGSNGYQAQMVHRAAWSANDFYVRFDSERLGSDRGMYSFQTPLGNLHAFQGAADKFLVTPAGGLLDRYVTVGALLTSDFFVTGASNLRFEFHRYRADVDGADFGREWDFSWERYLARQCSAKLEYADYRAGEQATGPTSVRKLWLTLNYTY